MRSKILHNLILLPLTVFALTYWGSFFYLGGSPSILHVLGVTWGIFWFWTALEWKENYIRSGIGHLLFAVGLMTGCVLIDGSLLAIGTRGEFPGVKLISVSAGLLASVTLIFGLFYRYSKVGEGELAILDGKILTAGARFRALPFIDPKPLLLPIKTESPMLLIVECADVKATARIETEIELHPERAAGRSLDFAAIVTHARDAVTRRLARPTDEQLPGKPEHLTLGKFLKKFGKGGLGLSVDHNHPNDFPATCRIKGVSLVSVS